MRVFNTLGYIIARLCNRRPSAIKNSKIHSTASVGNGAQIVNTTVGRYSYIYGTSIVNADVGAFCSIAAGCTIGGGSHPINWVSTSPVFYKGHNVLNKNFSNNAYEEFKKTTIGNDVWIGSKCLIKGGIEIGDGAVIGMGSVVTHDVPPYEVWAGNPAHFIKKRFDDEVVEKLLSLKWWEWNDEKLAMCGNVFSDVAQLFEFCQTNKLNGEE